MSDTLTQRRRAALSRGQLNPQPISPTAEMTAGRFLDNMANVPDLAANVGARAANLLAEPFQRLPSQVDNILHPFGHFGDEPRDPMALPEQPEPIFNPPALGQEYVPGPSGDDLMGAVQRVGETAGALRTGDFSQFGEDPAESQRLRQIQLAEENPSAALAATISGDVLTLLTGRAPIAKARGLQELGASTRFKNAVEAAKDLGAAERVSHLNSVSLAPNVKAVLTNLTRDGSRFKWLANRSGRATEAGLEGMVLSALNGEADPYTTAGIAVGTQAGSSLLLAGGGKMFSGGVTNSLKNLVVASAVTGGAFQLLKSGTIGGNDYILPSMESGFDKTLLGIAAGTALTAAGQGRVTGGFPVQMLPSIADSISAIGRASFVSIVGEMSEDPAVEAVMSKVRTNPNYFTPAEIRRLDRAVRSEDVSMSDTINDLMRNQDFAKRFEEIN